MTLNEHTRSNTNEPKVIQSTTSTFTYNHITDMIREEPRLRGITWDLMISEVFQI